MACLGKSPAAVKKWPQKQACNPTALKTTWLLSGMCHTAGGSAASCLCCRTPPQVCRTLMVPPGFLMICSAEVRGRGACGSGQRRRGQGAGRDQGMVRARQGWWRRKRGTAQRHSSRIHFNPSNKQAIGWTAHLDGVQVGGALEAQHRVHRQLGKVLLLCLDMECISNK